MFYKLLAVLVFTNISTFFFTIKTDFPGKAKIDLNFYEIYSRFLYVNSEFLFTLLISIS